MPKFYIVGRHQSDYKLVKDEIENNIFGFKGFTVTEDDIEHMASEDEENETNNDPVDCQLELEYYSTQKDLLNKCTKAYINKLIRNIEDRFKDNRFNSRINESSDTSQHFCNR